MKEDTTRYQLKHETRWHDEEGVSHKATYDNSLRHALEELSEGGKVFMRILWEKNKVVAIGRVNKVGIFTITHTRTLTREESNLLHYGSTQKREETLTPVRSSIIEEVEQSLGKYWQQPTREDTREMSQSFDIKNREPRRKEGVPMMRNNAREEILMATGGGLEVFRHYLPKLPIPSRINFRSPFYEDGHASCNIFEGRDGVWRYKDHGDGGQDYGDCFWFVGKLYGLEARQDFPKVLDTIINDLSLSITSPIKAYDQRVKPVVARPTPTYSKAFEKNPITPPQARPYSYKAQPYSESDFNFWQQYGITQETLTKYMVYSLFSFSSISRAGRPYTIRATPEEPLFGYVGEDHIKVYRPHSKVRFLNGGLRHDTYVFGYDQLPSGGDHLIITGGEKDVLTLASHGYNAIALNSETATLPLELYQDLSARFDQIHICYDMDDTGLKAAKQLQSQYPQLQLIHLPLSGEKSSKDISDYFKEGRSATWLQNAIEGATPRLQPKPSSILTEVEQVLGRDWKEERLANQRDETVQQKKGMRL